jgi:flagella basal body P-ring formation protein FlgA
MTGQTPIGQEKKNSFWPSAKCDAADILLVVALVWFAYSCVAPLSTERPERATVAVAAHDLPAGVRIQQADVKLVEMRWQEHPHDLAVEIFGHKTRKPIAKGEFFRQSAVNPHEPPYDSQFP